jgi:asparagine synthase (glutamine-hydrolysing)
MLSGLVHEQHYRVVLTGEGADEVFGGYDLFKETKIRQFWARDAASAMRPALLRRLYPYLDASPGRAKAYAEAFFRVGLEHPAGPFFSHLPRWTTTARCKEFFSEDLRAGLREQAVDRFEAALPPAFGGWHWFNKAQYLESRSLLGGYLLCSQGDRMLMANSVEGRFPFLDHRVVEFARTLPPTLLMQGLTEKYLLKRALGHELPPQIVKRPKQPYRAPGVAAFFDTRLPRAESRGSSELSELLRPDAIRRYGYFDPQRVERLVQKAEAGRAIGEKDSMAVVGILSTQLLHREFIEHAPADSPVRSHDLPVH